MKKHPHACGEDPASVSSTASCRETPPRVWGRHPQRYPAADDGRNTPTHVGKTERSLPHFENVEKHPHACGEDGRHAGDHGRRIETPPRMWGRLRKAELKLYPLGNTPTHVGKTLQPTSLFQHRKKHPHACGEDASSALIPPPVPETPPRMWGRPAELLMFKAPFGNTPTHVGKTHLKN